MNPKSDRPQSDGSSQPAAPAPRKRFLVVRLEERVAPKKGGGTKNCHGDSSNTMSTDTSTVGY